MCPEYTYLIRSVVFQDQAKRLTTNMTLFYFCTNCKHLFRDPEVARKKSEQAAQAAMDALSTR